MKILKFVVLLGLVNVFVAACSGEDSVGAEVDRNKDCFEVCNQYSDCVSNIDVTSCTEQCEDNADANQSTAQALETCEQCLDNKSCQEAEPCWNGCPVVTVTD